MAKVLICIPQTDFDPTEVAIPWRILNQKHHTLVFATPAGEAEGIPKADPHMLSGKGLGPAGFFLKADNRGQQAYEEMQTSPAFQKPTSYDRLKIEDYDGLILPGGHAQGMKPYLESTILQNFVRGFFQTGKPVGAICHGVLVAARSGVLFGLKTTSLTKSMELTAWNLTRVWAGDYYLTYPEKTVEDEVRGVLKDPSDYIAGPKLSIFRDTPERLNRGFVCRDRHYLSARWPGDAHRFAQTFLGMLS